MADPTGFDYFHRGEPFPVLSKKDTGGFDYFRRSEPVPGIVIVVVAAAGQPTVKRLGGVQYVHSLGQGVW